MDELKENRDNHITRVRIVYIVFDIFQFAKLVGLCTKMIERRVGLVRSFRLERNRQE